MSLGVLTAREASSFACLVDTVIAPAPPLPPVRDTDAVVAFDAWLEHAPALNRALLRATLHAFARMRRLTPTERLRRLERAGRSRLPGAPQLTAAITSAAAFCYYGDADVMRVLGYDPDARITA